MFDDILELFGRRRRSDASRAQDGRYHDDDSGDGRDRGAWRDHDDDDDQGDRRRGRRSDRSDSFFDD
jgi:hypothetical protein